MFCSMFTAGLPIIGYLHLRPLKILLILGGSSRPLAHWRLILTSPLFPPCECPSPPTSKHITAEHIVGFILIGLRLPGPDILMAPSRSFTRQAQTRLMLHRAVLACGVTRLLPLPPDA